MPQDCPSSDELQALHAGTLAEETAAAVIEHISTCQECQAFLDTLGDADDSLLGGLRAPVTVDPYADEEYCREAIRNLETVMVPTTATAVSDDAAALGELGEYRLVAKLGQGGMGTVYKAVQTKLDKVVAVKVLPQSRTEDTRAVARFEREMKAVGRLNHPNIVQALDAREIDGTHFLVMEYVDGVDLSELVDRCGPLPVADACELARQAALGLQYAHENGLVHRDIKPSNLMLSVVKSQESRVKSGSEEGSVRLSTPAVKILDLGLALLGADQPNGHDVTGTGQMMGTADYVAPEQVSDSHNVDIRADIYSLGCTLYKLLTGQAPFSGPEYKGAFDVMLAHRQTPAPPICSVRSDIPDELSTSVHRMLAKEPDDRFATPAEVAAALETFANAADLAALSARAQAPSNSADGADLSIANTDPYRTSAVVDTKSSQTGQPDAQTLPSSRRWKPWTIAAAVAPLFIIVLAGIVIWIKGTRVEVEDGSRVRVEGENVYVEPPKDGAESRNAAVTTIPQNTVDPKAKEALAKLETDTGTDTPPSTAATSEGMAPAQVPPGDLTARRKAAEAFIEARCGLKWSTELKPMEYMPSTTAHEGRNLPERPFFLYEVRARYATFDDYDASLLKLFPELRGLRIDNCPMMTTDGVKHLMDLHNLRRLMLGNLAVTDASCAYIGEMSQLHELALGGDQLTDAGLAHLRDLTNLRLLQFGGNRLPITDYGVRKLPKMPHLESLKFWHCNVTGASLAHFKESSNLTSVRIHYVETSMTNDDLKSLENWPDLESLTLDVWPKAAMTYSDDGLVHVGKLSRLTDLCLRSSRVTDAGLVHLAGLTNLKQLSLNDMKVTGEGLHHITNGNQLESIGLSSTMINDEGLKHLANQRVLKTLSLDHTKISSAGLAHLANLRYLNELSLVGSAIDDSGLIHLEKNALLRQLNLQETKVTAQGVAGLKQVLRNCQTTVDSKIQEALAKLETDTGTDAPPSDAAKSKDMAPAQFPPGDVAARRKAAEAFIDAGCGLSWSTEPQPEEYIPSTFDDKGRQLPDEPFFLYGVMAYGDKLDNALVSSLTLFPELRELRLDHCPCTEEAVSHLTQLQDLRTLWLGGDCVSDASCVHVSKLPRLESLTLLPDTDKLTDAGLAHLRNIGNLRSLHIRGNNVRITDFGIEELPAMPHLESIFLYGCPVTGASLAHLNDSPHLKSITLCLPASVTDGDLKQLDNWPELEELSIGLRPGKPKTYGDDGLAHVGKLLKLKTLSLGSENITDAGLAHLAGLTNLKEFSLAWARISGNGLDHIMVGNQLEKVGLSDTELKDEGLRHLESQRLLKSLALDRTKITGNGLAHLAKLRYLETLSLAGTAIDDSGLIHLEKNLLLTKLNLQETNVTAEGVAGLKQVLRNCEITVDAEIQEALKKLSDRGEAKP